jgi:hypothetical protein
MLLLMPPQVASLISTKMDQSKSGAFVLRETADVGSSSSSSICSAAALTDFLRNPFLRHPPNTPERLKVQENAPMSIVWNFRRDTVLCSCQSRSSLVAGEVACAGQATRWGYPA